MVLYTVWMKMEIEERETFTSVGGYSILEFSSVPSKIYFNSVDRHGLVTQSDQW